MKIDTSKLIKKATSNTKLDLSKINNTEKIEEKKGINLSFGNLPKENINKPVSSNGIKLSGMSQGRSSFFSMPRKDEPPKEQQGFSLTFTDKKVYSLDTIVRDKRRDNANCPLILKVNLDNEYDREITELITILVVDKYLNANIPEEEQLSYEYIKQNYPTLIHKVPNFYYVFDEYFNKYYGYYYNQIRSNEFKEGSISLNTIKEIIVDSYNSGYDNLLGDALDEYAGAMVMNKPRVEYEMGTEQTENDPTIDTSYISLEIDNNKLYIKDKDGIIPGQDGVPFATINNKNILNSTENFEALSFNDYIELIQHVILLSKDEPETGFAFITSDDKCLTVKE